MRRPSTRPVALQAVAEQHSAITDVRRFVPALVISSDQVTEGAAIWEDAVAAVTA